MGWETIKIKTETKMLLDHAKQEFLAHHKEFSGTKITYNHIINQIAKFYIEH